MVGRTGKERTQKTRERGEEREREGGRGSHTRSSPCMSRHLRIFPFHALFNRISRLVRCCYLHRAMNNNEREHILNVSINSRERRDNSRARERRRRMGASTTTMTTTTSSAMMMATVQRQRKGERECIKNGCRQPRRRNGRDSGRPSARSFSTFVPRARATSFLYPRSRTRFHTNDRRVLHCSGVDSARSLAHSLVRSLSFPSIFLTSV